MSAARRERAALVATFREVGPHAPTLCEGWNATDLAAHLVVRERRLDATLGIAVPFLAGYTAKVQDKTATSTSWDALVDQVASGPPVYSPFKLLDPVANLGEMSFITRTCAELSMAGSHGCSTRQLPRRCAVSWG